MISLCYHLNLAAQLSRGCLDQAVVGDRRLSKHSGVGSQPGGEIGRALEVEQSIGDGFAQGAAAAVEKEEGHRCGLISPGLSQPLLGGTRVAQFFVGVTSNHLMESGD